MVDWLELVAKNGRKVTRLNGVMLSPLMDWGIHGIALELTNLQKSLQRVKQSIGAMTQTCVLGSEFYK